MAMKGIHFILLWIWLYVFFVLVTSPILFVSIRLMDYLAAHENLRILGWLFLPVMLSWLIGLPWITTRVAHHITYKDQNFGAAVRLTLGEFRLRLTFLPLVGHWFASPGDKNESDVEDDE